MACTVTLLVYVLLQFIAFLCVLVGTPLDMFHLSSGGSRFGNTPCITLWGLNEQCYTSRNNISLEELWIACPDRRDRFRRAQVFAIISICVYGLAALLGFIALCCCSCLRWVCLALNIAGVATLCVVWASMVRTYEKADGSCIMQKLVSLGVGFMLLVIAWCLDIINILLLLLSCPARYPSKGLDSNE
ncbi:amastin-like protein [Leishmania braziliensis MHOM/BR/75/M2904]|uniref:Amastin-like protein n=1 Tax=Leishmania braziliensis TaxID=5660 RepID=A4H5G9_LEIBR|nr:amastin-like protein [Leishmania braziliensis MHOM/BR/75/M2904]CAM37196.1 amastin-like protein [Leishmania braziliensis MHOM/BR/75/M2904]